MDSLAIMYWVGVLVGFMIRPAYNWLFDIGEDDTETERE